MKNFKKIFKISNILIVLLTLVLWVWNDLSISRMGVARHIHYKNASLFPKIFSHTGLIILTIILFLILIIEYIMLNVKNYKKCIVYILFVFNILSTIFMFTYDIKKIFIFYYVVIYIILINLILFFEILIKYLKKK